MALPVESLEALAGGSIVQSAGGAERVQKAPQRHEIADCYIHIDDGQFDPEGDYATWLYDPFGRIVYAQYTQVF